MRVRIGRFYSGAPEAVGVHAELDIPLLVESGAFIQAASGYGKTTLLVEVLEATHPHVQQIIIDPEGEFAPMRANFDYVIAAAHHGDALAHPRTAGLLATRLLETKASAILDIYDLKPRERHEFVREFIEAMMNAPKDLWHPVLVIIDEAHMFCPEKGFGESVATDVVIDLAARGRKRGFRLVAATQRIAKFSKSAAAELHTKFIGYAGIDDMKRVAFELGIPPQEATTRIRRLHPGDFYAYGRALAVIDPQLFKGELPKTKLPKAGKRKLFTPPKPTAAIKALLPKLADIPREVEQKAKTEQELRKELSAANTVIERLRRAEKYAKQPALPNPQKIPKVNYKGVHRESKAFLKSIETLMSEAVKELDAEISGITHEWRSAVFQRIQTAGEKAMETIRLAAEAQVEVYVPPQVIDRSKFKKELTEALTPGPINLVARVGSSLSYTINENTNAVLPGPQQRILDAIAWLESTNHYEWQSNGSVAFMAGYSPNGGGYMNPRGRLKVDEYIKYNGSDMIALTDKGRRQAARPTQALSSEEIHRRVLDRLDGPMQKILKPLIAAYPSPMTNEELAAAAGYAASGGGYMNPRGRLKTLGLIVYIGGGEVRASKELFIP